ncbi:hypothetical protein E4U11_003590 [Claviceps purpurea]|nr:hypothetical protein E4U11_003590 [Claviceps purpurea]
MSSSNQNVPQPRMDHLIRSGRRSYGAEAKKDAICLPAETLTHLFSYLESMDLLFTGRSPSVHELNTILSWAGEGGARKIAIQKGMEFPQSILTLMLESSPSLEHLEVLELKGLSLPSTEKIWKQLRHVYVECSVEFGLTAVDRPGGFPQSFLHNAASSLEHLELVGIPLQWFSGLPGLPILPNLKTLRMGDHDERNVVHHQDDHDDDVFDDYEPYDFYDDDYDEAYDEAVNDWHDYPAHYSRQMIKDAQRKEAQKKYDQNKNNENEEDEIDEDRIDEDGINEDRIDGDDIDGDDIDEDGIDEDDIDEDDIDIDDDDIDDEMNEEDHISFPVFPLSIAFPNLEQLWIGPQVAYLDPEPVESWRDKWKDIWPHLKVFVFNRRRTDSDKCPPQTRLTLQLLTNLKSLQHIFLEIESPEWPCMFSGNHDLRPDLDVALRSEFQNLRSFSSRTVRISPDGARNMLSNAITSNQLTSFDIVFPDTGDADHHLEGYEWLRGAPSIQTLGCYKYGFPSNIKSDEDLLLPPFLATFPNLQTLSIIIPDRSLCSEADIARGLTAILRVTHLKTININLADDPLMDQLRRAARDQGVQLNNSLACLFEARPSQWPVPLSALGE